MDLQHHGIRGQRWGVRRFQNSDGSLTAAGRKRYADDDGPNRVVKGKASTPAKKKDKRDVR